MRVTNVATLCPDGNCPAIYQTRSQDEAWRDKKEQVRLVTFYGRWLTDPIWDGDMLSYRAALNRRGRIAITVEDQAWGRYTEERIALGEPAQAQGLRLL